MVNVLFSCCILLCGFYIIYNTYKKPANLISTDMKGYFGGFFLIILSVLSIIGKFSLLETFQSIFHTVVKLLFPSNG